MLQTSDVPEQLRYRNTLDAVIKIYRNEGIPAFYKGLLPSLLGVFHVIVQFPLYEHFKSMTSEGKRGDPLSPGSILLCSGASKMLASLATYPHEVLRTRMQMQQPTGTTGEKYTGFLQTITSIARKEGFRGFYRGMSVNLVRTVPNSGLTILTYELLMHYFAAHTST
ncbi:mitochondrial nad transporter [Malassezia pachydermatis]|uniref:Mitochondrial nad transporter n=1 Tax=Malassezia pachydermatis TaxID=77020 RepID=A0A0M8MRN7_9BASI|nr:mitochondrial nad transporter [Malassezia pachydermatis]KOS12964.1 mitochondrial nad transporter [Malassezia pachydermatis]